MPKKELTPAQQVEVAVNDVKNAMLEKIKADKALSHASERKEKARYVLQKAKERLISLEFDFK